AAATSGISAGDANPADAPLAPADLRGVVVALGDGAGEVVGGDCNRAAAPGTGNAIVFIDSAVNDPNLIAGIPDGAEIFVLEAGRDGVEQMAEQLSGRRNIDAIHIISHGESGTLDLGNAQLTAESIRGMHADEMVVIKAALSADADILVYGCDVAAGQGGDAFVQALSEATGADLAASVDDTGHADLGGDWDLETRTGLIEAGLIDAPEWNGLLAPLVISTTAAPTVTGAIGTNLTTGLLEGGVGYTGLWTNAGTIGGTSIDIRATVVTLSASTISFFTQGDDPSIILNGGATTSIKWEIFASGTSQSVIAVGSPNFQIADIDGVAGAPNSREVVRPQLNGLTAYTTDSPINLVTAVSAAGVQISGTQNQNGESTSLAAFR
ncbi:MAG: DUF4347 domain-containing protein, partial [Hyphomicrobium sp.]